MGQRSATARFDRRLGVEHDGARATFRYPCVEGLSVVLTDRGERIDLMPEEPRGEGSAPGALVASAQVPTGARYLLRIGEREIPDPFARLLPRGPHAPAAIRGPLAPRRPRRPIDLDRAPVFYELHVGTFTPEGTFAAAADRLTEIAALGAQVIEVMPIASFAGERGWGYDGVAWLAPHAPYGSPEDVVAFVDRAHELGLSVILDVVLNHFGPSGNYLHALDEDFFDPAIQTPWGAAPRFSHPVMRALARQTVEQWIVEYGFDGLRLDATHAIEDRSEPHLLAELTALAKELPGPPVLIAEDDRNDPALITEVGLDGVWADDFHHAVHTLLTREQEGYYSAYPPSIETLARTIRGGWLYEGQVSPTSGRPRGAPVGSLGRARLVLCLENHDQSGNRAMGERFGHLVSERDARAAALLLCFMPSSILLFAGQEWGAGTPFLYFTDHEPELGELVSRGRRQEFSGFSQFADPEARARIPDPQARATFERSRLDWSERARAPHAGRLELYQQALALRASDPVLRAGGGAPEVTVSGDVLSVVRRSAHEARTLVWNLGASPVALPSRGRALLASTHDAVVAGVLAARAAAVFSS